jgi:uncharacterized protein YndB with AHSA1/START domain
MSAQIEAPASETEIFSLTRRFAASPELIWRVWTEEAHLRHWWGPAGVTLEIKHLALEQGGMMLYGMKPGNGPTHWGKFVYRLIEAPTRLAYVVSFTDDQGTKIRNPMNPLWPLEVLADQRFSAVDGGCEMISRSYPINATPQERQLFQFSHAGLQMGFAASLAGLDKYLAAL